MVLYDEALREARHIFANGHFVIDCETSMVCSAE
jgi:hypothetical protein